MPDLELLLLRVALAHEEADLRLLLELTPEEQALLARLEQEAEQN